MGKCVAFTFFGGLKNCYNAIAGFSGKEAQFLLVVATIMGHECSNNSNNNYRAFSFEHAIATKD